MSRIGNAQILIPTGVVVEKTNDRIVVKGAKGELSLDVAKNINVDVQDGKITVSRKLETAPVRSLHGLMRSLINNMVIGVNDGWSKSLELVGVGFRAQTTGEKLNLAIGFSHPVEIIAPDGIKFEVKDNTKIKVFGIDKYLVGQTAARIKAVRPPDVYKGKGVRYEGEYIKKKAGKAGKVGGSK